jgi:hypothetical protein
MNALSMRCGTEKGSTRQNTHKSCVARLYHDMTGVRVYAVDRLQVIDPDIDKARRYIDMNEQNVRNIARQADRLASWCAGADEFMTRQAGRPIDSSTKNQWIARKPDGGGTTDGDSRQPTNSRQHTTNSRQQIADNRQEGSRHQTAVSRQQVGSRCWATCCPTA